MRTYMRRAGITGAFLLLIYIIIYVIGSWRAGKSSPGVTDQEVVWKKLDQIQQTLNNLGEYQFRSNSEKC